MRAFAGVAHTGRSTSTVTRLCVYVDRTNGGDSYGDLTLIPHYGHRTCIVGKRGPAGDTSVVTWNKTVATPIGGGAPRGGPPPGITLATAGPFTVIGRCFTGDGTEAVTAVRSGQDGSSLFWSGNSSVGSFNTGAQLDVSNIAFGTSQVPAFVGEGVAGDFSASTVDQKTAFTGSATNGVYIQGASGPACSFTGYLVLEK